MEAEYLKFFKCSSRASRYYAPVAVGIWCTNWELGCEALGIKDQIEDLSVGDKGTQDSHHNTVKLPKYDVSWVLEEN